MSVPLPRFAVEGERYRALLPAMRGVARDPQTTRLARAIALADGFMLHLVGCESHQAAEALLLCLATLLRELRGHPLELAYLAPARPDEGPLQPEALAREVFDRLLAPDPVPRTVFLDATDCTEADRPAWRWLLQRLNERRNHLPAIAAPLTLLLPLDLEAELPALAPDLWSIRSVGARYAALLSLPTPQELLPFQREPWPELDHDVEALRTELENLLAQPGPQARRAAVAVFGRLVAGLAELGRSQEAMQLLHQRLLPSLKDCPPALTDALGYELVLAVYSVAAAEDLERLVRERALPAAERLGDKLAAAETLMAVADAYGRIGHYDRTARILEDEVLPRARALSDKTYEANKLAKLAVTHLRQGDLDAALDLIEQLDAPDATRPSPAPTIGLFLQLATLQLTNGQPSEAIFTLRHRVFPLLEHVSGGIKRLPWILLGICQMARGDLQGAIETWRSKALPLFEHNDDREGRAFVQGRIAVALRYLGRPDAARAYLRRQALPGLGRPASSPRLARSRRNGLLEVAAAFEALGASEAARRIRAAAELPAEQDLTAVLAEAASAENPAPTSPATLVLHTAAGPEVFDFNPARAIAAEAPPAR